MQIRGREQLLPTTIVGSYPRPLFLEGKVFPTGVDAPEFPSFRTRELYRDAVALAVKDQLDAGVDIVTDGGQHYESETDYEMSEVFHYFPQHLEGYLPLGDRLKIGAWDVPVWKPTAAGPVGWRRPVFKPVLEAVRAAGAATAKINIGFGPVTMAMVTTDHHYGGDVVALARDLAAACNEEMKDLQARGCEQVQIIEPLPILAALIEPQAWMAEVINRAFDGVSMYKVVHMCYGHIEGQPAHSEATAAKLFPFVFDLDCDQLHLEMAGRGFAEVEALRHWPADRDLGIGVLDGKCLRSETPEQIAEWIQLTAKIVPPEQICISSDCSLASLRRVVAKKKLAAMTEGTHLARRVFAGG